MFAATLILGTPVLALSIENWVFLWMLLELSSVGFIIFMKSLEMSMIYFLTQTFGSIMILFHLVFWKENMFVLFSISPYFLIIGLILKLGVVPMHQWFLNVGSKIKKWALFMLMTMQKVIPLLLFKVLLKMGVIPGVALLSAIFGVFFQLGVYNLKKLILYSSVVNMGWLILLSSFQMTFLLIFFLLYSLMLSLIVPFISTHSAEMVLGFMSLAGIPPLLGFFSKLIALKPFTIWSETWGFLLLILSVINTFIYFRVFMSFGLKAPTLSLHTFRKPLWKIILFIQIGFSMIFMII
uniref:NADH-ubiquinone oxidoreductase chain 2 n=1 Tax=Leptotrombidium deliense TaxID=299467 RepID=Q3C2K6_9ACAR|nr:NADH dehydrogenase subunit 2 [Leptotrombidium deliense]BAE47091.1 NADH dehydrogenase subunit 2 [Leptotrombidium deliense]